MGICKGTIPIVSVWKEQPILAVYAGSRKVFPTDSPAADERWLYEHSDTGVTLLLYLGDSTSVTIPDVLDGFPVTALAPTAFSGTELRTASLPASVCLLC